MALNLFEIREAVMLALDAIRTNKLRSFLTVLGVMIGVSSVIGMVSIITGLNNAMARQIESLGSNAIYISKHRPGIHLGRRSSSERNRRDIDYDHAVAIKEYVNSVKAVSPENNMWLPPEGNIAKYKGNEARRPGLTGVVPDYQVVRAVDVESGRFITEMDHHYRRPVCVLGPDVVEALFPFTDPLGKEILLNNHRFTVVGVAEEKEAFLGQSQDNYVLIPLGTFQKLYPWDKALTLAVTARSAGQVDEAINDITEILRRHRGLAYDEQNDFEVFTQDSLMDLYSQITGSIYIAMIVISGIGLFVGGIGVMNIMLVSVTERTREIGIRKAIGARSIDIVWQFLVEAMTLSAGGGIIGILVGLAIGFLVKFTTPLSAAISIPWIIIGFSVSVSVGLLFGSYPAYRAARVDPIISLRYE